MKFWSVKKGQFLSHLSKSNRMIRHKKKIHVDISLYIPWKDQENNLN